MAGMERGFDLGQEGQDRLRPCLTYALSLILLSHRTRFQAVKTIVLKTDIASLGYRQ